MTEKGIHIGVFSLAYQPFVGGAEIAASEIASRLPRFRFSCFTRRFDASWPREEFSGSVQIFRIGRGRKAGNYYGQPFAKILYAFKAWRAAEKLHQKEPFQAIWAIMASYAGFAALFFKLRHPKVKFLLTLQEGDSEEHILKRVGIFRPFWRMIFKKADYIQAISSYLMEFAKRHGAACPTQVVPNGLDLQKFQIPKSKLQINSKFQNPNVKTIITTSRLVYKNGVDVLTRAIAELKRIRPPTSDFRLLIVGGGPEEQKLKQLAKDLDIKDEVEFLGQVPADRVPEYLLNADIFVRASRSEGLGSSFLEAMAAGLPVIGTPVGGIVDFLKDGETGLLIPVDDYKNLAEKISILIKDEKLKEKIARQGKDLAIKRFSWDSVVSEMEKIFTKLCAS